MVNMEMAHPQPFKEELTVQLHGAQAADTPAVNSL